MEKQATIKQLALWLKEHDDFVLIGHVFPDGDAAVRRLGRALPDRQTKIEYDVRQGRLCHRLGGMGAHQLGGRVALHALGHDSQLCRCFV